MLAISLMGLLLVGTACYRPENKTLVLTLPDLTDELDKIILETQLSRYRELPIARDSGGPLIALHSVKANVAAQTITVEYNTEMMARQNITHLIYAVGYGVDDLPSRPEVREGIRETIRRNSPAIQ